MAVLKCKMCGGSLDVTEGMTVCECEYCGTQQTIPAVDDEKKLTLFSRANRLRSACEFDKAAGVYENIVSDFPEEAEAYWGLILCKYGIEYVDDPATGRKIPTCHRSSFESIMDDSDFEQCIENADPIARKVYREEAKTIDGIQKGILEISGREEPYDIFICYKETDDSGSRTVDSVIAQDIYDMLTENKYRVFFARISLEDKLGTAYEPYIFAALNSARIMLAVGTDYDYYSAVWVKNEWSRFLALMSKDKKKVLIPCYKGIDAYDIPKEFKHLQAQDMGKVGAMQDLLRGIKKILPKETAPVVQQSAPPVTQIVQGGANTAPMLRRAFMFLEDGEWDKADDMCEKVLNLEPENAEAYLAKLMVELKVKKCEDLDNCPQPFDDNTNFKKVLRFGGDKMIYLLNESISHIKERNKKSVEQQKITEDKINNRISSIVEVLEKANLSAQLSTLKTQESNLFAQRANLGIFAIIEKKRIDAELTAIYAKKRIIADKINEISKVSSNLETQIESTGANASKGYTLKEALRIYMSEPNVTRDVNAVLYPTISPDSIAFGRYFQEYSDQPEPIEWKVLMRENSRMLVISKYSLDCQPYDTYSRGVTWETSSLRKWLNETFINTAFSSEEQGIIISSTVNADWNPKYNTSPGINTIDKVFLLSIAEVQKYFSSDELRKCVPTYYAIEHGIDSFDSTCWWWLRSPGDRTKCAAGVNTYGSVYWSGDNVHEVGNGVRPAMWITLNNSL